MEFHTNDDEGSIGHFFCDFLPEIPPPETNTFVDYFWTANEDFADSRFLPSFKENSQDQTNFGFKIARADLIESKEADPVKDRIPIGTMLRNLRLILQEQFNFTKGFRWDNIRLMLTKDHIRAMTAKLFGYNTFVKEKLNYWAYISRDTKDKIRTLHNQLYDMIHDKKVTSHEEVEEQTYHSQFMHPKEKEVMEKEHSQMMRLLKENTVRDIILNPEKMTTFGELRYILNLLDNNEIQKIRKEVKDVLAKREKIANAKRADKERKEKKKRERKEELAYLGNSLDS